MNQKQLKIISSEEFLKESLEKRQGLGERELEELRQKRGQNYMELGMVYYCRANDQPLERCVHYSPTPSGESCTFKFGDFCRREERGEGEGGEKN